MDLFDNPAIPSEEPESRELREKTKAPLADRMRPRSFDEWVGQKAAAGPGSPLRRWLAGGQFPSLLIWGPPGSGKTTLARIIANETDMAFAQLSAVTSGVKDVKQVIEMARGRLQLKSRRTVLFIDEIHRYNKAQQDALLPHVEDGTIVLIGATTENPSFSVIAPLLSRCRVLTLQPLAVEELIEVLKRALTDPEDGLGETAWTAEEEVLVKIAQLSDGDARRALGMLEQCLMALNEKGSAAEKDDDQTKTAVEAEPGKLTVEKLADILQRGHLLYDAGGEEHFNLISAFHKSMRASDPDGAVYWLFRMLAAGEDPRWIARRILACASEDVGMADPQAMQVAVAAYQSFESLGLPEGELPLAQAAIYVATAPKSNSVNEARAAAKEAVQRHGAAAVPLHLRNAPTGLMKSLGYGRAYQYDHACPDHFSGQPTLPEALQDERFYEPGEFGYEKEIQRRIGWWDQRRKERRQD